MEGLNHYWICRPRLCALVVCSGFEQPCNSIFFSSFPGDDGDENKPIRIYRFKIHGWEFIFLFHESRGDLVLYAFFSETGDEFYGGLRENTHTRAIVRAIGRFAVVEAIVDDNLEAVKAKCFVYSPMCESYYAD